MAASPGFRSKPLDALSGTHKDRLGSVTRLSDANQQDVTSYAYSRWGDTAQSGAVTNLCQFTGPQRDSAAGS